MSYDEEALNREGRARVAALFEMCRPWQAVELMRREWQEEYNRLSAKPSALGAELAEAALMASAFRAMRDELKAIDDRESEEFDAAEEAGEFDSINEALTVVVKTPHPPFVRKYPHRYPPEGEFSDGRCVYCGQMGVTSHLPGEDCEVLRRACRPIAANALEVS